MQKFSAFSEETLPAGNTFIVVKNSFWKTQLMNLYDSFVDKLYSVCNLYVYEKPTGLCVRFGSI